MNKKTTTPKPATIYTAFRCPENLLEQGKALAKKERRSLSNWIITLIAQEIKVQEAMAKQGV